MSVENLVCCLRGRRTGGNERKPRGVVVLKTFSCLPYVRNEVARRTNQRERVFLTLKKKSRIGEAVSATYWCPA